MPLRNLLLPVFTLVLFIWMVPGSDVSADSSKLQISSAAITEGATIPTQYTCNGNDESPPLEWTGVPSNAKSLALLVEDPDAPAGTYVHWVVYNISPNSTGFKEGTVEGSEGINSAGKAAYMGPCPPPGDPHHYHFRLFALDAKPSLEAKPNAQAVRAAMQGHMIESADLVGIFSR